MSRFVLYLDTENDAFTDVPADEIARILRASADRILASGVGFMSETILDANGNDVGRYSLKPLIDS